MERTLIVFKPDAVMRGLIGEILSRFEKAGLKIVGMKMLKPSEAHLQYHYEDIGKMISRRGADKYKWTTDYVGMSPVIAVVLEGIEAVEIVRKMVGPTEPKSAAPGTIRGDYAHMTYGHGDQYNVAIMNLMHASGDSSEAKQEVAHWFKEDELFEYRTAHESFTKPGVK